MAHLSSASATSPRGKNKVNYWRRGLMAFPYFGIFSCYPIFSPLLFLFLSSVHIVIVFQLSPLEESVQSYGTRACNWAENPVHGVGMCNHCHCNLHHCHWWPPLPKRTPHPVRIPCLDRNSYQGPYQISGVKNTFCCCVIIICIQLFELY